MRPTATPSSRCPSCNAEIPKPTAQFCVSCGKRFQGQPGTTTPTTPSTPSTPSVTPKPVVVPPRPSIAKPPTTPSYQAPLPSKTLPPTPTPALTPKPPVTPKTTAPTPNPPRATPAPNPQRISPTPPKPTAPTTATTPTTSPGSPDLRAAVALQAQREKAGREKLMENLRVKYEAEVKQLLKLVEGFEGRLHALSESEILAGKGQALNNEVKVIKPDILEMRSKAPDVSQDLVARYNKLLKYSLNLPPLRSCFLSSLSLASLFLHSHQLLILSLSLAHSPTSHSFSVRTLPHSSTHSHPHSHSTLTLAHPLYSDSHSLLSHTLTHYLPFS